MKNEFICIKDHHDLYTQGAKIVQKALFESIITRGKAHLALSGGNTPKKLYQILAKEPFLSSIQWSKVQIFWGDERAVFPNSPRSNYRMAYDVLLSKIPIPGENVHRIRGEDYHETEADRYASVLLSHTGTRLGQTPVIDVILLGMGTDGHTASLFPGQKKALYSSKLVENTRHPLTSENRISLTLKVINNARNVLFMVTGSDKAKVIKEIKCHAPGHTRYPAAMVQPVKGNLIWLLDRAAYELIYT